MSVYDVYLQPDGRGSCPECGGCARLEIKTMRLRCFDCGAVYKMQELNQYNEKTVRFERAEQRRTTK